MGHTYLNNLLLPKVNRNGGRIVVTASAVHDPDTLGGQQGKTATLGDLEGFERDGKNFEMVDGNPYNGDKAYKDSKVCTVESLICPPTLSSNKNPALQCHVHARTSKTIVYRLNNERYLGELFQPRSRSTYWLVQKSKSSSFYGKRSNL